MDEKSRYLVKLALDPDVTFGVTAGDDDWCENSWQFANRGGNKGRAMNDNAWTSWFTTNLNAFRLRELTGNAAAETVVESIQRAPSALHAKWAGRVINRTLRAGFDISTFNKTFGAGSVEKFGVQLADTYDGEELSGTWYVQPKLDGNRVVFIDGLALSRNGKEYPNCQHVIDELQKHDKKFFEKWVLDGEMMGDLGFDQSSGALRRINEKNREKATFTYWVFDMISRAEWERRQTPELAVRLAVMDQQIFENLKTVKIVPTVQLFNPTHKQIMDLCDGYIKDGFEGAMLKDAHSPYVFKRGKNLLKVKKFFDADLKVVDFIKGEGKHKGRLGALVVNGTIDGKPIPMTLGWHIGHTNGTTFFFKANHYPQVNSRGRKW